MKYVTALLKAEEKKQHEIITNAREKLEKYPNMNEKFRKEFELQKSEALGIIFHIQSAIKILNEEVSPGAIGDDLIDLLDEVSNPDVLVISSAMKDIATKHLKSIKLSLG